MEQDINLHINVISKTYGTDCEIDVFILCSIIHSTVILLRFGPIYRLSSDLCTRTHERNYTVVNVWTIAYDGTLNKYIN